MSRKIFIKYDYLQSWEIFHLTLRWIHNKFKVYESSLFYIFYRILEYIIILRLTKHFEIMVGPILRKKLGTLMIKQSGDSVFRKTKRRKQHDCFCALLS